MARKTKEDAEKTRETLLDAAEQVFISKGVASATLEQIAREAGMTRGAVYWHFENKAAILSAIHERASAPLDEVYDLALQEGKHPIDALRGSCTHALRLVASDERTRNVFSILLFRCEKIEQLVPTEACPTQKRQEVCHKFCNAFEVAQQEGRLRDGLTPDDAAFALHAYMTGIFTDYLRYPDEGCDLHGLAPRLVDIFFHGVLNAGK